MDEGFIKLPRSVLRSSVWTEARPTYTKIFIVLLERCAYQKTTHSVNGNIIEILPGQVCVTFRKLEEWCGQWITKNDIEGFIKYFIKSNFLRQEIRHGKSIITIIEPTIYETCFQNGQTEIQTKVRQESDKSQTLNKKEKKERKKEVEKEIARDDSHAQKIYLLDEFKPDNVTLSDIPSTETTQHNMYYHGIPCEKDAKPLTSYQALGISVTPEQHENFIKSHGEVITQRGYEALAEWKSTKSKKELGKHTDFGRLKKWVFLSEREKHLKEEELKFREKKLAAQQAGSTTWGTPAIDRRTKNIDGTPVENPYYQDKF